MGVGIVLKVGIVKVGWADVEIHEWSGQERYPQVCSYPRKLLGSKHDTTRHLVDRRDVAAVVRQTIGKPVWSCGELLGMPITYRRCIKTDRISTHQVLRAFWPRSSLGMHLLSVKEMSEASRLRSLKSFHCYCYLLHRRKGGMD